MMPIHQHGIEVHRIEMLNGSHEFCQEFITDVVVPDSDRIGEVDDGWTVAPGGCSTSACSSTRLREQSGGPHRGGSNGSTVAMVAQELGQMDDPAIQELVGEARMFELVAERSTPGWATASGAGGDRPGGGHRAFVPRHGHEPGGHPRSGGGRFGRRRLERGRRGGQRRGELPHAPGGQHRGRHDRDGAQRDQRACARHAAERTLDRDVPFRDVPRSRPSAG